METPHKEYTDEELEKMFGDYGSTVDKNGKTSLEKSKEKMKNSHCLKNFKKASLDEIEKKIWETRKEIHELEFEISDYDNYNKFAFLPFDLDMLQYEIRRYTEFLEELMKLKETKSKQTRTQLPEAD